MAEWKKDIKMKRVFLAVAFMSTLSIQASATDYYVFKGGKDSNNGTSPATAWKTIDKVNNSDFGPGDSIFFKGGQTFVGNLFFDATKVGSASSPLTISSYGTGRATISAGRDNGIFVYNAGGVDIVNINFAGSGSTVNRADGIYFYSAGGNVKHERIYIDRVDVSGFGSAGVLVISDVGYRDVRVTNSTLHDNMKAGFMTWASFGLRDVHENVYVGGVTAYNNTGIATELAGYPSNDGSGIWFTAVSGGTIENSVAYNNGALCNWEGAGACGIWDIYSTGITIQNNEAHNNKTRAIDGGGFDLDKSVRNSVMQYNYSHDNDGVGYMLCCGEPDHYGNVVRYNTSVNDGRKNSMAGIAVYGNVGAAEIYGNTVTMAPPTSGSPPAVLASSGAAVRFLNNTFTTTGGLAQVNINNTGAYGLFFQGNQYRDIFKVITPWGSYSSIEAWRQAEGQEPL